MKKMLKWTLALALLAASLLLTTAALAEPHEHYAWCTDKNPSVCRICGATEDVEVRHHGKYITCISVNNVRHNEVCIACGTTLSSMNHYTYCDQPDLTACIKCGSHGSVEIFHDRTSIVDNGNGTHSAVCELCGKASYTEEHYVFCWSADKTCCEGCGGHAGNIEVSHGDWDYKDNSDDTHTCFCLDCGETIWIDTHNTECTAKDQTRCIDCGAHSSDCYVFHDIELSFDNGDGTHTTKCLTCGAVLYTEAHYTWCANWDTTVCCECGAKDPVVEHDYRMGVCVDCGKEDPNAPELVPVMKNGQLGYEAYGVFTPANGLVEYQGGLFLVDNGSIMTDKDGLVKTERGWYYFAGGQAQIQHTGFVQYDGAWFYVTGGKMDASSNGLYSYDGSKFLVAAGQVRYDYSGLFLNEGAGLHGADGKWYFISGGQVQTQYTGLAQYDGHWFYLVNGVLAESYTGTVAYNGGTFNVVNGMVV